LECFVGGTLMESGLQNGNPPSCSTNPGYSKFAIYFKEE
jgi:hypothetical protein